MILPTPTTSTEAPPATVPPNAWKSRAKELAEWTIAHLVNRRDVWGAYYVKEHGNEPATVESFTAPTKKDRDRRTLGDHTVLAHFGNGFTRSIIGLHSTSIENTCKWIAIDIDRHENPDDPNFIPVDPSITADAALGWYEKLSGMGFHPILTKSNGKGGYHLRVLFAEPIASDRAYALAKSIVTDWQRYGLPSEPETFPKQAKLGNGHFGNWLRLPGKHPKNGFVTTVYNGEAWLENENAIDFLLSHTGDDPKLVPSTESTKSDRPKGRKPKARPITGKDKLKAIEAMKVLSPSRADVYDDWLKVGLALHHTFGGSQAGLDLWDEWSQQNSKYQAGETVAKWDGFKGQTGTPVTLGTLLKWATDDSKGALTKAIDLIEGPIRNFEVETIEDPNNPDAEPQKIMHPLTVPQIIDRIKEFTGDWPRRIGDAPFVHKEGDHKVAWLKKSSALFGYLNSATGAIHWQNNGNELKGFVTQEETFAEVQRLATSYDSIEALPHYPKLDRRYYLCGDVEPGNGDHLRQFLDFFSPATDADADLMLAMVLSAFWGGPFGSMPCFAITSDDGRGAGKSTFAMCVSDLAGGSTDVSPNEDITKLKERLLTLDAITKRIVLVDNLKSFKFSWGELEALLTARTISGRRLYFGEAERPNNLLWVVTLNGANFSEDMAQRTVLIKVRKSEYRATFADEVRQFTTTHRMKIVADAIGMLADKDKYTLSRFTRWAQWEREVLACVADPGEAQKVILERQGEANVDAEEAAILEDHISTKLTELHYDPLTAVVRIPNAIYTGWFCEAFNEKMKTTKVTRQTNLMLSDKKLKRIRQDACHSFGRCWVWYGDDADIQQVTSNDIESRIDNAERERRAGR